MRGHMPGEIYTALNMLLSLFHPHKKWARKSMKAGTLHVWFEFRSVTLTNCVFRTGSPCHAY